MFDLKVKINYRDLNKNWKPRLDTLTSYLQESAILHSETIGFDANYMLKNKCAWILNKLTIEIFKLPELRDEIKITTWSREIHTVKAYRDFNIYLNDELIARASSLWVFVDATTKKLKRIPDEVKNMYGEEKISNGIDPEKFDFEPDEIKNQILILKEHTIRYTDIDTNGHMNNTTFFTLLEDILLEKFNDFKISEVNICFKSEVLYNQKTIKVGLTQSSDEIYNFIFFNDDTIFSYGRVKICF